MNILEKKLFSTLDPKIKDFIKLLQFDNFPIDLIGSASLQSQKYYSDFDIDCLLTSEISKDYLFKKINTILKKIEKNKNMYLIEVKYQRKDGESIKLKPNEILTKTQQDFIYSDLDYIKIDLVVWNNNRFVEMSINYKYLPNFKFIDPETNTNQYINEFKKSVKEYQSKNNYYKALKRKFNIYSALKNNTKLNELSNIFNSKLGEMYQKKSNLEAILLVHNIYDDVFINSRIKLNLKELNLPQEINKIPIELDRLDTFINSNAKKLDSQFPI